MRLFVTITALLVSILIGSSALSQPESGCSAFSTETFNIYDARGRIDWEVPDMECVEYFDISVSTPHGVRHIRGIGDINVGALMPLGGVAAIERGARASAARFGDLGDYKIPDVVILITPVDAQPDELFNPDSGVWKHASALADASGRRTSTEGLCPIRMFTINDLSSAEMEQTVAHELFHCVQFGSLSVAQNKNGVAWWVEGSAMLFTNHVFPELAPVMRRERRFRQSIEEQVPIHRMAYEALYPFLYYDEQVGIDGLLPLLRTMPATTDDGAQITALQNMMAPEQWLQFAQRVDDRKINYRNGELADFGEHVDGRVWTIDQTRTLSQTLKPFVLAYGWADYECGLWGNRLNPSETNIAVKPSTNDAWEKWPRQTDCRDKGSERYRMAALHTGGSNLNVTLRAERQAACTDCVVPRAEIDRCLIGTWEQTSGGPLEWMRTIPGMPASISTPDMGRIRMTFREDGTFTNEMIGVKYDMSIPDRDGARAAQSRGSIAPSTGRWSSRGGVLNACFDSGGQSAISTTVTYPDGRSGTASRANAGYAGISGSNSYRCSGDSLTNEYPMPRGGPMRFEFRRVSTRR